MLVVNNASVMHLKQYKKADFSLWHIVKMDITQQMCSTQDSWESSLKHFQQAKGFFLLILCLQIDVPLVKQSDIILEVLHPSYTVQ